MRQATQQEIDEFVKYRANHIALVERLGKLVFGEDYSKHDYDKCTPTGEELNLHALRNAMINGKYNPHKEDKRELNNLVKKHVLNSHHHPESWSTEYHQILKDDWNEDNPPQVHAYSMPKRWLREMIADWSAVALKRNSGIFDWYNKTCTGDNPRFIFTDEQKKYIVECLELMAKAIKKEHIQYPGVTYNAKQGEPIRESLTEKILKKGDKWQVTDHTGTKNLGTYNTREEAEKRLKQVEYFKHVNESKESLAERYNQLKEKLVSPNIERLEKEISEDKNLRKFMTTPLIDLPDNYRYLLTDKEFENFKGANLLDFLRVVDVLFDDFTAFYSTNDKKLLGWFAYKASGNIIANIKMFSFNRDGNNVLFMKDVVDKFKELLNKYNIVSWSAHKKNPFIKHYFDAVKEFNGNVEEQGNTIIFTIKNKRYKEDIEIRDGADDKDQILTFGDRVADYKFSLQLDKRNEAPEDISIHSFFESIDISQSENFKKWFGNSKVVDEGGNPLVVYHGSHSKGNISIFNTKNPKKYQSITQQLDFGTHFTVDYKFAKSYAWGNDGKVYSCYLKIENPLIIENGFEESQKPREEQITMEKAIAQGYDGIIYTPYSPTATMPDGSVEEGEPYPLSFIVFEPNQIKSATNNNGEFSMESDRITEGTQSTQYHYWKDKIPYDDLVKMLNNPKQLYETFFEKDEGVPYEKCSQCDNYIKSAKEVLDLGKSDKINLYRTIAILPNEKLDEDDLGICWAWDIEGAEYFANTGLQNDLYDKQLIDIDGNNPKVKLVRINATTNRDNIDWAESIYLHSKYYREHELRIYNPKDIEVKNIIPLDRLDPYGKMKESKEDNFKKWFGNSKVVDENGNPLVVYHGTYGTFDSFSKEARHSNSYKRNTQGFYFTDSREVAREYGDNIIECFLKITNPKIVDAKGRGWEYIKYNKQELSTDEIVNLIRETEPQYDGIIFKNIIDESEYTVTDYVVFEPNQIKSATNNNGEYSMESNKITEELFKEEGGGGGAGGGASGGAGGSVGGSGTGEGGVGGGATNTSQGFMSMAPAKPAKIGKNKKGIIDPSGQLLKEEIEDKTAVFTFGRLNPISEGHLLLFKKVESIPADAHLIYTSHTQDAKKNPLDYATKSALIKYVIKTYNLNVEFVNTEARTIIDVAVDLYSKGYKNIIFVGGEDRVDDITNLIQKYNDVPNKEGKAYHFDNITSACAGHRDPDADDVTGASGTKLRQYCIDGDFESFYNNTPIKDKFIAKDIYEQIRNIMVKK